MSYRLCRNRGNYALSDAKSTRRKLSDLFAELEKQEIIKRYASASNKNKILNKPVPPITALPYKRGATTEWENRKLREKSTLLQKPDTDRENSNIVRKNHLIVEFPHENPTYRAAWNDQSPGNFQEKIRNRREDKKMIIESTTDKTQKLIHQQETEISDRLNAQQRAPHQNTACLEAWSDYSPKNLQEKKRNRRKNKEMHLSKEAERAHHRKIQGAGNPDRSSQSHQKLSPHKTTAVWNPHSPRPLREKWVDLQKDIHIPVENEIRKFPHRQEILGTGSPQLTHQEEESSKDMGDKIKRFGVRCNSTIDRIQSPLNLMCIRRSHSSDSHKKHHQQHQPKQSSGKNMIKEATRRSRYPYTSTMAASSCGQKTSEKLYSSRDEYDFRKDDSKCCRVSGDSKTSICSVFSDDKTSICTAFYSAREEMDHDETESWSNKKYSHQLKKDHANNASHQVHTSSSYADGGHDKLVQSVKNDREKNPIPPRLIQLQKLTNRPRMDLPMGNIRCYAHCHQQESDHQQVMVIKGLLTNQRNGRSQQLDGEFRTLDTFENIVNEKALREFGEKYASFLPESGGCKGLPSAVTLAKCRAVAQESFRI